MRSPYESVGCALSTLLCILLITSEGTCSAVAPVRAIEHLHIYALFELVEEVSTWHRCFVGNTTEPENIERCKGVCVLKYVQDDKFQVSVSYGCQEYDNYPLTSQSMCLSYPFSYPNAKGYYSLTTRETIHKLCCKDSLCNRPDKFTPVMPKRFVQKEKEALIHYSTFVYSIFLTSTVLLIILPVHYWRQSEEENMKLRTSLNNPIEKAVLLMEQKPKNIRKTRILEKVTANLSLDEITHIFAVVELHVKEAQKPFDMPRDVKFKEYQLICGGLGHSLLKARRVTFVKYESLFWSLLEHGPYSFNWKPIDLVELFDQAKDLFDADNTLLHLSFPVCIFGDIRGQYADLHRWLKVCRHPPRSKLLFLGGVLDASEAGSLDCLAFICVMKIAFPNDVFMLRGIGETVDIHFGNRFDARNDYAVKSAAIRLCGHLPLAARINKKILAVHSGISHQISNPKAFNMIRRPFQQDDMPHVARELIFNEPSCTIKMYRHDEETNRYLFGFTAVNKLVKEMDLSLIVRGRNPLPQGILFSSNAKLISLWSAPAKESTMGACLKIDAKGVVNIYKLSRQPDITLNSTQSVVEFTTTKPKTVKTLSAEAIPTQPSSK